MRVGSRLRDTANGLFPCVRFAGVPPIPTKGENCNMAKINPKTASEKLTADGFGGVRFASALTGDGAARMRNFRVAPDGSLEKRCGMTTLYSLNGTGRGVWQGTLDGNHYLMAVASDRVYVLFPNASAPTVNYYLQTSEGPVCFAVVGGVLYLFDGDDVYRYFPSVHSFSVAYGYVPLYGVNWHPTMLGNVNEPMNMVYPRLRIRYLNSSGSTTFNLPFTTRSIDRADVDGVPFTNYSFTPQSNSFQIPQSQAHGVLTVSITLSSIYSQRSAVARTNRGYVYRNASHETLLLYGGESSYRVYHSAAVSEEMLAESNAAYSNSDPLYFQSGCGFYIGDIQHPIHVLCRDRNRVLALSDRSVWAIQYAGDDLVCYPMSGGVGCSAPGGMALCGNDPVVVQDTGVYRLDFPSGESDVCVASVISDGVSELFPASLYRNGILAWFPDRNELWLRDPDENAEGLVWVRSALRREWYCFDGIFATVFFELDGKVGFGTSDGRLVLPDENALTDDGAPIAASYRSHFLAFSHPEQPKRAYRMTVCADTGGETLTLTVKTDRGERSFSMAGQISDNPEYFDFRAADGRFRFLRDEIAASGSVRTRIYRLSVLANV